MAGVLEAAYVFVIMSRPRPTKATLCREIQTRVRIARYQALRTVAHTQEIARGVASRPRSLTMREQLERRERREPEPVPEPPHFAAMMEEYFAVLSIHKVIEWLEVADLPAPIGAAAAPLLALKSAVKRVRHAREHEESRLLNQLRKDDSVIVNDVDMELSGSKGKLRIDPTSTCVDDRQYLLGGAFDLLSVERHLSALDGHLELFLQWTRLARRAVRDEALTEGASLAREAKTRGDDAVIGLLKGLANTLHMRWHQDDLRDVMRSLREQIAELRRAGYQADGLQRAIERADLLT